MKTLLIKNLVIATLFSFTTVAFSTTPPPTEKQSISKELVKQITSAGVTTFDWVVKYENTSGGPLENVEIIDTFSSNQSYVPSSEQHPNGWSATQTGNSIQWDAALVGDGGYARPFSPIPTSGLNMPSSGNGDGWAPIPYTALNGDFRIYYINHHRTRSQKVFGCVGSCIGSWPIKLLDGDTSSSVTTGTPNNVKTAIVNRKLYYSVTRSAVTSTNLTAATQDWGVGCFDLENNAECGYTSLSNNPNNRPITLGIDGPYQVGNKLYFLDSDLFVHCFDPSGPSTCTSHDLKSSTSMSIIPNSVLIPKSATDNYGNRIGAHVDGTHIYFDIGNASTLTRPSGGKIICFDTAGMNKCAGWSDAVISTREDIGYNAYFHRDSSGSPTHICTAGKDFSGSSTFSALQKDCFKLANGMVDNTLPNMISSTYTPNNPTANLGFRESTSSLHIASQNKSFFNSGRNIFCYDWSRASVCTIDKIVSPSSSASTYGQAIDDNGCVWVLGHNNQLWSYNPETNIAPCQKEEFEFEGTLDASKNWCATEDPEWAYTQFQITNITASDFEEIIVEILDDNGAVIETTDITGLSNHSKAVPTASGDSVHYRIKVKLTSGRTEYTTLPLVTIGVDGPPSEFCFQTTVDCPNTEPVVNDVLVQIQGESPDATDQVVVEAESACGVITNDDSDPISCPATTGSGSVDVVILVDSSSSMSSSWAAVIDASDTLAESIKERCGADANITLLSIDKVDPGTGASAPAGFISHEKYIIDNTSYTGAFANNDGGGAYEGEQGAKAIADVSNHFPWKEGACRSILYISDEWLDSVNKGEAGSTASIPIGVGAANSNSVTLFTHLVGYGASNPIKADHFTELAESTGGTSHIGDTPSKELYKELVSEAACNCGCEELPEDPKSCLVLEPKLECIVDKGWHVSFTNSTPGFTPTYLDITSLTSGVSVVGNSPTWTLSGVTPNSTVKLSANGVMKNGGSEKGNDLCCSSEVEIEIPEEECPIIDSPVEACMVAETTPAGPFFDSGSNQWSFPLQLTSLNINTLDEVKVTPVTTGVIMMNGPVYPVGTPSLSFTGVTTGQTVEFNFCAYNRSDKEENETYDCCKMNVRLKIRESVSPKDYQQLEVVK